MNFADIKKKSEADLKKLLDEKEKALKELRFKVANQELKDIRDVRMVRKEIAQILTSLSERVK